MAEVLIVDDSKVMREMIASCLRQDAKLVLSQASSGLEAIERLSSSLFSAQAFDMLVLDLNMQDVGGLDVIQFVRTQGNKTLAMLPILIVTTYDDDESREKSLAAGATDFMTKPFAPGALLAAVQSLLKTKHHHRQQDHRPRPPSRAG